MLSLSIYTYPKSAPGSGRLDVEMEIDGATTVRDALCRASVDTPDYYVIMLNGYGANLEAKVVDGDHLVLFPAISGG